MNIPTPLAGTITIIFLVAFGTFIYPLLLKRRGGGVLVGVLTVALAALFYVFDAGTGAARSTSLLLALIWSLLPVATGVVVWRLQSRKAGAKSA